MRQVVIDTETTGLSVKQGHLLVEFAAVEIQDRVKTGNVFHTYINPHRSIDPGAQAVHGITSAFLQDKPTFEQVANDMLAFMIDAELIIHNAPFDLSFLNHQLGQHIDGFNSLNDCCQILDTLIMARKKHPGQKNSLDALCKRYKVDNSHRTLHGALLDADLLADLYLVMTGGQVELFAQDDKESKPGESSMISAQALDGIKGWSVDDSMRKAHREYQKKFELEED